MTWVSLTTVTEVAATPPTETDVVPMKPEPVMVMVVPPAVSPEFGETFVMIGVGAI